MSCKYCKYCKYLLYDIAVPTAWERAGVGGKEVERMARGKEDGGVKRMGCSNSTE